VLWSWHIGAAGDPAVTHTALPPMGDPPTVHPLRDGGALLAGREADTGVLTVMSRPAGGTWQQAGGTWPQADDPRRADRGRDAVTGLGGQGGFGVVAIQPHADGVFLAQRGRRGLVEVVWQPRVGAVDGVRRWLGGPGPILHPSLAVDARGKLLAAAIGPEGALYTARIDAADAPRTLDWQPWDLA